MNMDWNRFCSRYALGALSAPPRPVSGGLLHKMFRLQTAKGAYAVKLLNPSIMARKDAPANFAKAEALENRLMPSGAPILGAMALDDRKLLSFEGHYAYVFPWFDGKPVKPDEVTAEHAQAIGRALALIHQADQQSAHGDAPDEPVIDWRGYADRLKAAGSKLYAPVTENLALLQRLSLGAAQAAKPDVRAICHNDLDCKNVLWQGLDYRIIDLECLDYGDPSLELFQTALYWSRFEALDWDVSLFRRFLRAYFAAGGYRAADSESLYLRDTARLGWLEYCLTRALGQDEREKVAGEAQAVGTLTLLQYYDAIRLPALEAYQHELQGD